MQLANGNEQDAPKSRKATKQKKKMKSIYTGLVNVQK